MVDYLAQYTLEYNSESSTILVVLLSPQRSSNRSLQFEVDNHEEADTRMTKQAIVTISNKGRVELTISSPEKKNALVLAITNYYLLPRHSSV